MARIHAKSVDVLVDEFNFESETNSAEVELVPSIAEVTAFADADATFVEGKPTFRFTLDGLFSTSSENYDGEMFTDLTTVGRRVGIYPDGFTDAKFGWEGETNPGPQERSSDLVTAIALNVTWQGDKPLIRSQVLDQNTSISSTETGTAYEHGSVSATQKVVGIVRLLAAPGGAGSNDCDVTIESDTSGFPSATTQLTFTTLDQTSTATHEVMEANGSIGDTFWRSVVTISGGGSRTFNLVIVMGIIDQ
tara:strand:+ start:10097 stop:10843 length:747 start_codon:yes stop_codon:yes gene_type:complete